MKTKALLFLNAVLVFSFCACSKKHKARPALPKEIHMAVTSDISSKNTPQHWKDGVTTNLPVGAGTENAIATALFIDGKDVYISGQELPGPKAVFWKNDVRHELQDGPANKAIDDIIVKAGDVYTCGRVYDGTYAVASYWKNDHIVLLSNGNYDCFANAIAVSGSDVYVVGYENNETHYTAKLWKNGVVANLTKGTHDGLAYQIAVSGNDVYVTGVVYNGSHYVATLWKNGVAGNLSDGDDDARAERIFLEGNDMYVAGRDHNKPVYWKNGTVHELPPGSTYEQVDGIFVLGGKVYACGYIDDGSTFKAKYWKEDGKGEIIGLDVSYGSRAYDIGVK